MYNNQCSTGESQTQPRCKRLSGQCSPRRVSRSCSVVRCARFSLDDTVRFIAGQNYLGGRVVVDSAWRGWITAVDASTGNVRWRHSSPAPVVGAVTATAGWDLTGASITEIVSRL